MANRKLSAEQITEIVNAYKDGETMQSLSERYNVHINTISLLVRKNGLSRKRRGNGEFVHMSLTMDVKLIERLAKCKPSMVNMSMFVTTIFENWLKRNEPKMRQK